VQSATFGKYSRAKVVLPAPLGPAIIQHVGIVVRPGRGRSVRVRTRVGGLSSGHALYFGS
jgi:hypothetical protein